MPQGCGPGSSASADGVAIPLQAAEHYYLITDTVPGMDADLAVIEDGDRYGYYRPEGDGMMVGLFEPRGAAWSVDGVPDSFAFGTLPPDWERMGPFLEQALGRIPSSTASACARSSADRSPSPRTCIR